jgi:hypothetical protein
MFCIRLGVVRNSFFSQCSSIGNTLFLLKLNREFRASQLVNFKNILNFEYKIHQNAYSSNAIVRKWPEYFKIIKILLFKLKLSQCYVDSDFLFFFKEKWK